MKKDLLKKIGVALGILVLFLGLSYGFVPQVLQGKIVNQSDISGYLGMSREMNSWNHAHPEDPAYWTDSMFGGMPTTAISNANGGDATQWLYDLLLTGKRPATYLFITLLGAFLLMLALGVGWPLAIGGAIAVAFCSYNFQIIQVGHNTKMQAIAFFPWVLAAVIYTYRKAREGRKAWSRVLLGAVLFALALSLQIKANHQQITYYLAVVVLLYALAELIEILVRKRELLGMFAVASALLLVLGGVGIATNVNKLLPLAKYTPHTMRGGSELSGADGSKGLDLAYATSWSYGWEELPNLMIPNYNGGSSAQAVNPEKSETIRLLRRAGQTGLKDVAKSLPLYWGPQPFTAGPMYIGAISVFLFLLGLLVCKGKERWWLLAATLIAILMAVGSHFMAFTRFCFAVLPLYNKFRTVSMALVILQVTLPAMGFLVLDKLVRGQVEGPRLVRDSLVAALLTGGFCLVAWLVPGIAGDFTSAADAGQPDVLVEAFQADRRLLLKQDALAGFLYIGASLALILWAAGGKSPEKRRLISGLAISVLLAVNLFSVGKRYLNSSHFTTPKDFTKVFTERPVDQMILADEDPSYRVVDLSVSVFNSSVPSYRHKNVGGYSPAKLQRYQDLIDRYLNPELNAVYGALQGAATIREAEDALPDTPLLNALNTRYFIIGGEYPPMVNDKALGTAWLVDRVVSAGTPDEELALVGRADLRQEAVIGADFSVPAFGAAAPGDTIAMTLYSPNELRYHYTTENDRLAVFSEIYYPDGWNLFVDGEPAGDLLRADWTFRAAVLPAGEHEVMMRFRPRSYRVGARVSLASSLSLLVLLLLALGGLFIDTKSIKS